MQAKRAAQAALFLLKAGGAMPHVKLMRLLYITDRESYRIHGAPITRDSMVSMPQGPVLSGAHDLMIGKRESADWSADVRRVHLTRMDGRVPDDAERVKCLLYLLGEPLLHELAYTVVQVLPSDVRLLAQASNERLRAETQESGGAPRRLRRH